MQTEARARGVEKVEAYITRVTATRATLLLFTQRGCPQAGWQVPAGTVEPGESLLEALHREIHEESGLRGLEVLGRLGTHVHPQSGLQRHAYHLAAPPGLAASWPHRVHGIGEDHGMVFEYSWVPLVSLPPLHARFARWIPALLESLAAPPEPEFSLTSNIPPV